MSNCVIVQNNWYMLCYQVHWLVLRNIIERFSKDEATSKTMWKWRDMPIYGCAHAILRHFHVVFDVASSLLNLSIICVKVVPYKVLYYLVDLVVFASWRLIHISVSITYYENMKVKHKIFNALYIYALAIKFEIYRQS